jgi:hypothetical protein
MDDDEARELLSRRVSELRELPYTELKERWLRQPDCEQVRGLSGVEYQIEIEAFWDDFAAKHLRLVLSIDDGRGWRAFAPITDSFIIAPDGHFVGE